MEHIYQFMHFINSMHVGLALHLEIDLQLIQLFNLCNSH